MGTTMDVRDVGAALWRQRLVVLVVMLIGGAAVAGGLWLAPKTYESTARIEALKDPASPADAATVDRARRDLAEAADSPAVLDAVRERLDADRSVAVMADEVEGGWEAGRAVIEITVRDEGPGIPAELRDQVFEPFFTTKARGGGLGLPIARRTAEIHGGTLTLSCPTTGGTVMRLTLPTVRAGQARPSARPAPALT